MKHFWLRKKWLASGLIILLSLFIQPVMDWQVMASASVSEISLANSAGLSKEGRLILYKARAEVVDNLPGRCPSAGDGYVEQGCYLPSGNKIYVRQMPQHFKNTEVVVTVHEMLHAAYAGLSEDERQAISTQLVADYTSDQKFISTMVKKVKDSQAKTSLLMTESNQLMSECINYALANDNENYQKTFAVYKQINTDYRTAVMEYSLSQDAYEQLAAEYNGQPTTVLSPYSVN
jgi:hypothetical protein